VSNTKFTASVFVNLPKGPGDGSKSSSNTVAIVLGVIGGIIGFAIIGAGVWYCMKKKNNDDPDPYAEDNLATA